MATHKASDMIRRRVFEIVERVIYSTRILLIPFYLCLVIGLIAYSYDIVMTAMGMITSIGHELPDGLENTHLIQILSILDIVMVGNLVIQILIGSYATFVRPLDNAHKRIPLGLKDLTPGKLKVKMSMSIIGVSSIHLLRIFVQSGQPGIPAMSMQDFIVKITIHAFFIVSAIVMAKTDNIMEGKESETEDDEEEIKE